MKRKSFIFAFLILLSTLLGCRMFMKMFKPNFFAGNGAYKAAQAVKSKIGVPFRVRKVEITEETFTMTVESPVNPRNIDEYNYIGVAAIGPKVLPFDPYDAKETDKMAFDEIDFTVIPQIIKNALEKIQLEGGAVKKITFYTKVGNKFGWNVEVQGTRERATARADLQGNIVSTNLSQTSQAVDYKFLTEIELNKAIEAIKAKFGADVKISELRIDEKHLGFKTKNPQNADEVFQYAYSIDGLKKAVPIALPASMISGEFALSELNTEEILNLVQKTKAKLQMPDGLVDSIEFTTNPGFANEKLSDQWRWIVSIKQGANKATVKYDSKFNEIPADTK